MSLCPKISIVIPMYNVEKYIGDCLESIARQGYESLEVICVDDGSTDGSLTVAEEWHKQHPILELKILQQSNKRQAVARNPRMSVPEYYPHSYARTSPLCILELLPISWAIASSAYTIAFTAKV